MGGFWGNQYSGMVRRRKSERNYPTKDIWTYGGMTSRYELRLPSDWTKIRNLKT